MIEIDPIIGVTLWFVCWTMGSCLLLLASERNFMVLPVLFALLVVFG